MQYDTKDVSRFWSHVDKSGDCWLWSRALNNSGYAFFKVKKKMVLGHRFAWTVSRGEIPAGALIDHMCRNRECVNPEHLQLADRQMNVENLNPMPSNNATGHLNVYKRKYAYGYQVIIRSHGKAHNGGIYRTVDEAAHAARDLRNRLKTNNLQDRTGM